VARASARYDRAVRSRARDKPAEEANILLHRQVTIELKRCATYPNFDRANCLSLHTSAPAMVACPLDGLTRPQSIRIVVVFPAPFARNRKSFLLDRQRRSSTARIWP
jgi:hypothetical protein